MLPSVRLLAGVLLLSALHTRRCDAAKVGRKHGPFPDAPDAAEVCRRSQRVAQQAASLAQGTATLGDWTPELSKQFELVGLLGKGSFGAAYLAKKRDDKREVVVKVLTDPREDAKMEADEECKVAAEVHKASGERSTVMQCYGTGSIGASYYMLLQPAGTVPLETVIEKPQDYPLTLDEELRVMKEMFQAVALMHKAGERGYAHLDIKPENIVLFRDESNVLHARLIDLGFATPIGNMPDDRIGSVSNMAPEQYSRMVAFKCSEPKDIKECKAYLKRQEVYSYSQGDALDSSKSEWLYWECDKGLKGMEAKQAQALCIRRPACTWRQFSHDSERGSCDALAVYHIGADISVFNRSDGTSQIGTLVPGIDVQVREKRVGKLIRNEKYEHYGRIEGSVAGWIRLDGLKDSADQVNTALSFIADGEIPISGKEDVFALAVLLAQVTCKTIFLPMPIKDGELPCEVDANNPLFKLFERIVKGTHKAMNVRPDMRSTAEEILSDAVVGDIWKEKDPNGRSPPDNEPKMDMTDAFQNHEVNSFTTDKAWKCCCPPKSEASNDILMCKAVHAEKTKWALGGYWCSYVHEGWKDLKNINGISSKCVKSDL